MDFTSDNACGVSGPILKAILAAGEGAARPYGEDCASVRAAQTLCAVFERDLSVFLVATGTAANALALGSLCPPWGAVFCWTGAHVMEDECGAPEMFTAGAKLVGVEGEAGKIAPSAFKAALAHFPAGDARRGQPAALSLSQATETGSVYQPQEIAALSRIAHEAGMSVHMDGARFANAVVELGASPAELSWKAGVDALSFGATKNGALACEAVLIFDPAKARTLPYQRKRSGHLLSKGRFLGAQMNAYLEDGHWLENARTANHRAARLAAGLAGAPGVRLPWRREANEVFAILPAATHAALRAAGAKYYEWPRRAFDGAMEPGEIFARLVTSFATREDEVETLIEAARGRLL